SPIDPGWDPKHKRFHMTQMLKTLLEAAPGLTALLADFEQASEKGLGHIGALCPNLVSLALDSCELPNGIPQWRCLRASRLKALLLQPGELNDEDVKATVETCGSTLELLVLS